MTRLEKQFRSSEFLVRMHRRGWHKKSKTAGCVLCTQERFCRGREKEIQTLEMEERVATDRAESGGITLVVRVADTDDC